MAVVHTHLLEEPSFTTSSIISLTGGGGKTTLLFALGEGLSAKKQTVLGTTTTRMFRPTTEPNLRLSFNNTLENIKIPPYVFSFAARTTPHNREIKYSGDFEKKVYGYLPEEIDAFYMANPDVYIIVEADGAFRKPLKAPALHEPVIPGGTRIIIAVIGLSCFYLPFNSQNIFRIEEVAAITGLDYEQSITAESIVKLILHPNGLFKNSPQNALKFLFCNQADLPGSEKYVIDIHNILHENMPHFLDGVYFGSLQKDGLSCFKVVT